MCFFIIIIIILYIKVSVCLIWLLFMCICNLFLLYSTLGTTQLFLYMWYINKVGFDKQTEMCVMVNSPSPGVKPRAFRLVDKVPELGDSHL